MTPKEQHHGLPVLKGKIRLNFLSLWTKLCLLSVLVSLKHSCCGFFSHYVLNLEYARQVKEIALFFQEFVCNLPATAADKKLKNATYLSVTTDIQKYAMC